MAEDGQDSSGENFLARWARRKAAAPPHAQTREVEAEKTLNQEALAEILSPGEEVADATGEEALPLPRLEDILPESSVAEFLRRGIPEALKRAALRKAWTLDPAIRDFIEVAENQYDFNNPASIPGFGELPSTTDMAALLKQATGMLDQPDGAAENALAASDLDLGVEMDEPGALACEAGAVEEQNPSSAEACDDVLVPQLAVETGFLQENPGQEMEVPLKPLTVAMSRRHGGALPR